MKSPKELAKSFDNIDFVEFISLVQKEAYNQAIQDAADSADADYTQIDDSNFSIGHRIDVYVIKDSILKLKIK